MFEINTSRIPALDGLRGLAIILVILNHFRLQRLYDVVPTQFHVFLDAITNNGRIGVGLLFMLSGFLMVKIYPQVISTISFYQKRYTRIFPTLITMCFALAIIRHFWTYMNPLTVTLIVSACLTGAGIFWRILQKSKYRISLGKKLFWLFFLSQELLQSATAIPHVIYKASHPFKEIEAQRIIVLILPALLFLLYFQRSKAND